MNDAGLSRMMMTEWHGERSPGSGRVYMMATFTSRLVLIGP